MNKNYLFIPAIALVLFGAWYFSMGKLLVRSVDEIERSIYAEEQKLAAYRMALSRFHEQIDDFRRNEDQSKTRAAAPFTGEHEIIALYTTLDSLCGDPEFDLHEITPSLEETISFLKQWSRVDTSFSMPIRIKLDAGYRSLARLVKAIETHRYFSRVQSCRIYGSDQLYPNCALDFTFIARLGHPMEPHRYE